MLKLVLIFIDKCVDIMKVELAIVTVQNRIDTGCETTFNRMLYGLYAGSILITVTMATFC